ncbi:hypothetical protein WJX84_009479 [Apatococcus fuscideae]|uniref:Uncharacterized protein n=1 Tax=Apatococcus fuscideae TaxID=2026836 RepID=A0AAW1TGQ8_9CHLO
MAAGILATLRHFATTVLRAKTRTTVDAIEGKGCRGQAVADNARSLSGPTSGNCSWRISGLRLTCLLCLLGTCSPGQSQNDEAYSTMLW